MERTVSRRIFVGSLAVAMPLVAGGSRVALAQSVSGHGHIHDAAQGVTDEVFEHAMRQFAVITNKVRRLGATAEDARIAAAHLSMLAVYGRKTGIDAQFQTAVQDLVRSKGRSAVLDLDIDQARVEARLKRYGVEVDVRVIDMLRIEHHTRVQALEDLSHFGISGVFARAAADFE